MGGINLQTWGGLLFYPHYFEPTPPQIHSSERMIFVQNGASILLEFRQGLYVPVLCRILTLFLIAAAQRKGVAYMSQKNLCGLGNKQAIPGARPPSKYVPWLL